MKKLFFTALLLCVVAGVYGQKKVLKNAEKAFKKGEYAEAYMLATKAAADAETKDDPETHIVLGKSKLFQFQANIDNFILAQEANDHFAKAIELGGEEVRVDLMVSTVLNGEGKFLGGGDGLALLLELLNNAGNAAFEKDDFENAYQYYSLSAQNQDNIVLDFYAGYTAYASKMFDEAVTFYGKVIQSAEEDFENTGFAFNGLIDIYMQKEDLDSALVFIKMAQVKFPEDRVYKDYEIDVLIQADKMGEAIEGLKKTVAEGQANAQNYYTLSYLQWNNGNNADALASALKALEIKPDLVDALYIAGSAYFNQGGDLLKEANEIDDNDAYEAKKKEGMERLKLALPYFEKSLEINPEDLYSMRPLSTIYDQLDMDEKRDAILAKIEAIEGR
ncbi:MAG: tetratricopeptide (TPR) repeat protein [Roseivirga sp.]|jgi:tetratricopeptide (TPR) repeat protein